MDKARLAELVAALERKPLRRPCARCGGAKLEVVGEATIPIDAHPDAPGGGGAKLPTVVVACSACGHVWHHALGALGVAPKARR